MKDKYGNMPNIIYYQTFCLIPGMKLFSQKTAEQYIFICGVFASNIFKINFLFFYFSVFFQTAVERKIAARATPFRNVETKYRVPGLFLRTRGVGMDGGFQHE